jgi:OOP family OmpA-OmpF porin
MKRAILLFIIYFTLNPLLAQFNTKYELKNLGRKVNTGYHEAAPVISPDGQSLYFFVTNHPENTNGKEGSQDIWMSQLQEDKTWGAPQHLGKPLNNHNSNQVFNILPDGRIFIRGGRSKNSRGFSFTQRIGNDFSKPEELDVEELKNMNNGKFYGATISSDGKHMIIYMSEKEKGTFSDLYVSHLQEDGKYSIPVKLGDDVNTHRDEFGPFLASDDKTLYYSSNRKDMGFGSADVYMVTRLDDTWRNWSDPVNMGSAVNTSAFDAYLSQDSRNNIFVTMAGDPRDGGNLDIFKLVLKKINIRMQGLVFDEETQKAIDAQVVLLKYDTLQSKRTDGYKMKLPGEGKFRVLVECENYKSQTLEIDVPEVFNDTLMVRDFYLQPDKHFARLKGKLLNQKTNEQVLAHLSIQHDIDGLFEERNNNISRTLREAGWYYIAVSAEGFLNGTDSVFFDGKSSLDINKDIYLKPIEIGTTVRLDHIYFDFDKTTLQEVSFKELNKIVDFLKSNPRVEIEIAGHTDSKGADEYNLNLSQGRAEAVVEYLMSQDINGQRLIGRGYGETKPVSTNDTEEGRAENRRVEFTVLKK